MMGGKNSGPRGFTIIEVMLFLAISGMMFVLAANMVNGKQANAEFKDGTSGFNQQIQTTIDEVTDGNYPALSGVTCSPGNPGQPTFNAGSPPATYSGGCVFVGKALQLAPAADSQHPSGGSNVYNVFTLIGNQTDGTSIADTPTSLHAAYPLVLDSQSGAYVPNETVSAQTQYGLSFFANSHTGFQSGPCAGTDSGVLVFATSFGKYDTGVLQSGAQSVQLYCLPNTAIGATTHSVITALNSTFPGSTPSGDDADAVPTGDPFVICVTDGKGDDASITVGADTSGKLTTSLQIGDSQCQS